MTSVSPTCAISIGAGGLSKRMGRSKADLRLGSNTLLGHIRNEARTLGLRVRIVRRDLVPRCGPLGGIYTVLKTSVADAELFLACDMPFVSSALMARLIGSWKRNPRAAFFTELRRLRVPPTRNPELGTRNFSDAAVGFPLLLPVRFL